jgi:hypothetical protein
MPTQEPLDLPGLPGTGKDTGLTGYQIVLEDVAGQTVALPRDDWDQAVDEAKSMSKDGCYKKVVLKDLQTEQEWKVTMGANIKPKKDTTKDTKIKKGPKAPPKPKKAGDTPRPCSCRYLTVTVSATSGVKMTAGQKKMSSSNGDNSVLVGTKCEETTGGGLFIPGHDSRFKSLIKLAIRCQDDLEFDGKPTTLDELRSQFPRLFPRPV